MKRFESYEECMEEIERRRNSGWYQSWEGYVLELDGEYYPAKDAEERQHAMDCGWNWIKKQTGGLLMERYELENGKVFEIIRWPDGCTVVKDGTVVYSGTYSGCRRYIESMK